MVDKTGASGTVQDLADKIKLILENPELIAKLAERDLEDGSITPIFDDLDKKVSELEKLYPESPESE